ncbi:MAG: pilus assembly protein [Actinomycetota bacterium]|nr:pilus assembly protein [Actinomycetota bacterium]
MVFVLLLALGVVQTALILYARNVVISSAHEGARAAVELGRDPADAGDVARATIASSARGLVNDLNVEVVLVDAEPPEMLRVHVSGDLAALGPVPIEVPVETTATALMQDSP